ncbi:MAG: DOMON-like domain-containing protein [Xanthobacteraceae bacterium]|jgi:hypothetical protein
MFTTNGGMRQSLKIHPDSLSSAATHIDVDVAPHAGSLVLSYIVTGKISHLRIPSAMAAARTDELWRHTCFEAFVRTSPDESYYEFNFSPSSKWAAYHFSGYRSGMRVATEIGPPVVQTQANAASYTLQVLLKLALLPSLPGAAPWRLGLSAVIEETSGRKSYWALAHPPGKPDFHRLDCFTYEFSPASPP